MELVWCVFFRQQRDQAAHSHASSRQAEDQLVERQAELSQQAARLAHESQQRRHLEALLDEGLQVQNQILLGLQVLHHPRPGLLRCGTCADMLSRTKLQAMSYRLPCCDQIGLHFNQKALHAGTIPVPVHTRHDRMCMLSRQPESCSVYMHVTSIMYGFHVGRSW